MFNKQKLVFILIGFLIMCIGGMKSSFVDLSFQNQQKNYGYNHVTESEQQEWGNSQSYRQALIKSQIDDGQGSTQKQIIVQMQNQYVQTEQQPDQYDNGSQIVAVTKRGLVIPPSDISYDQFIYKYKQDSYMNKDPAILLYRTKILQQNLKRMKQHNSQPGITFTMGINPFADMTAQQFKSIYLSNGEEKNIQVKSLEAVQMDLVSSDLYNIDWSCLDYEVLQQGVCNSDYVFSTLNAVYLTMKIHQYQVNLLSAQEIISCGQQFNPKMLDGCRYGNFQAVLQYIKNNGVGPAKMYSYNSEAKFKGQTTTCNKQIIQNPSYKNKKIHIQSYGKVGRGDCVQLVYRLRFRALAVSIDSTLFPYYKDGVIHTTSDKIKINHSVTLIGYNPVHQFYKVKNSWGSKWGLNGYAYVTKSTGICEEAYYPILKKQKVLPTLCKKM